MSRKIKFQTISWFWDLYNRNLLELDPPYQRRSVWNQDYKDFLSILYLMVILHLQYLYTKKLLLKEYPRLV